MPDSLWPHESQHAKPPCPSPTPRVHSDSLTSIESVMPSSHLILCRPLLLLPSRASGSFPMYWPFAFSGQNIEASASTPVFPMNTQGWFPLGLTGLISLISKRHSRAFSNSTVQKNQFFSAQLYSPTLTSIQDCWKKHSFDYTDLCWQNNVSAFWYAVWFVIAFLLRSKCLLISCL